MLLGWPLLTAFGLACGGGDVQDPRTGPSLSMQGNAFTAVCGTPENPCSAAPAPATLPETSCDGGTCGTAVSPLCAIPCTGGQACVDGACSCPAGQAFCAGACVDTTSNAAHCGGCDQACSPGQTCAANSCMCPTGQTDCGAGCVDTQTSLTDCGGCGQPCAEGETCMAGACRGALGADGCSGPARGLGIDEIAIYQSVKIPIMQGQVEVAGEDREADVVAGRQTLVRVFVRPEPGFAARELSARVSLFNDTIEDQYFAKQVIASESTNESTASTFMIFVPPEKITADTRYSVEVVECGADPGTGSMVAPRFPVTGDVDLGARETGLLKIAIVPVLCNSQVPDTSESALAVYREHLKAMYPVTDVEFSVTSQLTTSYPINWSNLLEQVRDKRQSDNPEPDVYYYGFVKPTATVRDYCRGGCTAGVGYVTTANQGGARAAVGLAFGDSMSSGAMAHEVGHNHGRNHAPCAPGGSISGVDPSYPYGGAALGTWGFDFRTRTLIDPDDGTDIMGYCNLQWVSDYTYRGFTDRVAALNGNFSRVFAQELSAYRVLVVDDGGARWSFPITTPVEPFGEAEPAEILDAAGRTLTEITVYRTEISDARGFTVLIPEPKADWHSVRVLGIESMTFAR